MSDPTQESFELVRRAQDGDDAAVEALLVRHLPSLRVFVRAQTSKALRDRESDSDLVQTVCREALRGLDAYEWRGEGSFRNWLFKLAVNKLRGRADYHGAACRAPNKEERLSQEREIADVYQTICSPSQHAIAGELIDEVEAALDDLEPGQLEVFLMAKVMGMSYAEIAAELDKTEQSIRSQLSRALTRLSGSLQKARRAADHGDETPG